MSRFGDDRDWMNDTSYALEQRAKEVGDKQAMLEMLQVLATHLEYYSEEG